MTKRHEKRRGKPDQDLLNKQQEEVTPAHTKENEG